ncbi:TRAP transporter small permease [Chelativorans sp. AA-79]|uniref:TRAP transporter small permease n=1 Tax=Chelativorans sp. AA-79 TaxID=3028735 RepID=UPI0023F6C81A|nr:TRAP transporter small permease [Chelativorans sp. AA-79]WEX10914.1 TRAP transporter small permease [Chelativorans sp. AA-79]
MTRMLDGIDRLVEALVVICFGAIVLVGAAQVFNRYFFNFSLSWSEEFQRYGQIWMIFLAIPVAYRRGMHIGMETLHPILSDTGRRVFLAVVDILWLALAVAMLTGLERLVQVLQMQRSPGLGLPMHWVYGGMILGALYMAFVAVRRLAANAMGQNPDRRIEQA